MDSATLGRVFEPFFTTHFLGRGLGLSAVLGIVKSQKGAIRIDSEVGVGTTVLVLFPAGRREGKGRRLVEQALADNPRWQGTVLVIDDELAVLKLASRMMTRFGFEVLIAPGGREALELVARHPAEISLVLLDLSMPDMDGMETCRQLQQIKPGVRVIASSGYAEQECIELFQGLQVAGFVQKPYSLVTMKAKLQDVLGE